jgi:hypothetical protein
MKPTASSSSFPTGRMAPRLRGNAHMDVDRDDEPGREPDRSPRRTPARREPPARDPVRPKQPVRDPGRAAPVQEPPDVTDPSPVREPDRESDRGYTPYRHGGFLPPTRPSGDAEALDRSGPGFAIPATRSTGSAAAQPAGRRLPEPQAIASQSTAHPQQGGDMATTVHVTRRSFTPSVNRGSAFVEPSLSPDFTDTTYWVRELTAVECRSLTPGSRTGDRLPDGSVLLLQEDMNNMGLTGLRDWIVQKIFREKQMISVFRPSKLWNFEEEAEERDGVR